MNETELNQLLRERFALRVDDETLKYLARKSESARQPIEFFATDARTGSARREILDPGIFSSSASSRSGK